MKFSGYLDAHPHCDRGEPPWRWALATASTLLVGTLAAFGVGLWQLGQLMAGGLDGRAASLVVALLAGVGFASRLPAAVLRAAELRRLAREGRHCYAVTDEELFVTDGAGRGLLVDLDTIVELRLDVDELSLRIDDVDHQGTVYAIVFGCFDEDGPSAERCFDALARRLQARSSPARIEPALP